MKKTVYKALEGLLRIASLGDDGAVTLTGELPDPAKKEQALARARRAFLIPPSPIILKVDSAETMEEIKQSQQEFAEIGMPQRYISLEIGAITEDDIELAREKQAEIVLVRIAPHSPAVKKAGSERPDIYLYADAEDAIEHIWGRQWQDNPISAASLGDDQELPHDSSGLPRSPLPSLRNLQLKPQGSRRRVDKHTPEQT